MQSARERGHQPLSEIEFYRLFVNEVHDYAIFAVDLHNRVLTWNSGVRRVLGYRKSEFIGYPAEMVFTPEDRHAGAHLRELRRARQLGRSEDERWHLRKNGERFWASGVMTALRDASGRLRAYVKIMRDQTQRHLTEEKLQLLNERLEQRVRERTRELESHQRQLRALALELSRAEQAERRRITAELHDNVAQLLALCAMQLGPVLQGEHDEQHHHAITEASRCLGQAIESVRELLTGISPVILGEEDLPGAAEWAADPVRRNGLTVRILDDGRQKPMERDIIALVANIIRELLYNVLKHAGTRRATVRLSRRGDFAVVAVQDPGRGFDASRRPVPTRSGGFGLFSIRERTTSLGGEMRIRSGARGTTVTVTIPLRGTATDAAGPSAREIPPGKRPGIVVPAAPRRS